MNTVLYRPLQSVYILPVSQTVQKDHWFVPSKLPDYTALTGEYRPFRPVNLIRAGTKKKKKKNAKKPKTSHCCHTTHHNVAVVSERYQVVEQLFHNCRCFFFVFFSFFLSSSSFFLTLYSTFLYFLILSAILNSEYWCE